MFYKIVFDDMIIDAISNPVWVIWLNHRGGFVGTDPGTANGIVSRDGSCVYHIAGKGLFLNYREPFRSVSVVEITEEEYENLMSQIITGGGNIEIENHEPTEIEVLQRKVDELEQYARGVSVRSDGLAEQLEATKILLGVE